MMGLPSDAILLDFVVYQEGNGNPDDDDEYPRSWASSEAFQMDESR